MSLFKQGKVVGDQAKPGHDTRERCVIHWAGLVLVATGKGRPAMNETSGGFYLVRPADRVAMQDDVDCIEHGVAIGDQRCDGLSYQRNRNRADVEKPRPILGAINQQARGQNIDIARYWWRHGRHQTRCRRDGVVPDDEQEGDAEAAYS
jgi:hypothetical protein